VTTLSLGARLAVALTFLAAGQLSAQKRVLVPDDSIGAMVGVASRLLWRDVTLVDAFGLQTGIAYPVRLPRLPLQLELDGWTALAKRSTRGFSDQYSANVHYQRILVDRPHPKSLVFGYAEYWNPIIRPPNPRTRAHTRELSVSGLFDIGIPQQGIRTIHFQLDAARDLAREKATWMRGGANASIGTTLQGAHSDYSLAAILSAAVSASDFRGPPMLGPRPAFGFHSADVELDFQIRARKSAFSATTALQLAAAFRAKRLGANVGWVGLRESVLLP
jgi:hypothetical protein